MSHYMNASSWTSFLESITSFSGDLSTSTAPPFILSPTSLVEYSQNWGETFELALDATSIINTEDGKPAEELRMLKIVKWFVSTLKSQYISRSQESGSEKKPLNPFLGEIFVGKWPNEQHPEHGETILLAEQVSHHPPVTAYTLINDKKKVRLEGYNQVKASLSRMILSVKQYGHAVLSLDELDEHYLITFPPLHLEGLLIASPCVELEGKSYIQSSTGLFCVFEYSGKGYFTGKRNSFKARIFRSQGDAEDKEKALYTIRGLWSDISYISEGAGSSNATAEKVFYNAKKSSFKHLQVKPIEEQFHLESRRAWDKVARAIRSGDYEAIHKEKSAIEQHNRDLRKQEKAEGIQWQTRWFQPIDYSNAPESSDKLFKSLANAAGLSTDNVPSGTMVKDLDSRKKRIPAIHWRFVRSNWDNEKEVTL
ncbi:HBR145Cp [Eremothecium sinecaudum]|uniref:HBR145Cp n=1 Tax=Eremothecium sinecaudum TaxID=45286 RepID=A0A109UWV9_9SACH|nr:HBR145Cp [Eremothecium sinecaudum]AMD19046.1 HBR145Cp [Eremothecium sinecaudum]